MNVLELRNTLLSGTIVKVDNNEGDWAVLQCADYDHNIVTLKNLSSGFEGKFALYIGGKQKVFPLVTAEKTVVSEPEDNITFVVSSQAKVFEEKPEKIPIRKRKGRPKKIDD